MWVCSEDQSSLDCADAGLVEDLGCGTSDTGTVPCDDGVAQRVGNLGAAALDACGGCVILAEEPGTLCGECSTAVYECGPAFDAVRARSLSASGWSDVLFEASNGYPTRPGPNAAVWQSAIVGVDGTLTSSLRRACGRQLCSCAP